MRKTGKLARDQDSVWHHFHVGIGFRLRPKHEEWWQRKVHVISAGGYLKGGKNSEKSAKTQIS
jgi:hypothetical protein